MVWWPSIGHNVLNYILSNIYELIISYIHNNYAYYMYLISELPELL